MHGLLFFILHIDDFKAGRVSLLVATDVAARGLDVSSIGLVIQADAPRQVVTGQRHTFKPIFRADALKSEHHRIGM